VTLLIVLALAGILLIIVEIIFIPGTTIVGFFGGAMSIYAIVKAYIEYGANIGHIFLGSTIIGMGAVFFLCLHYKVWHKLAITSTSEGKAIEDLDRYVSVGDKGSAVSDLKPMGKALINDKYYEVQTLGEFCAHSTAIAVVEVNRHKIIVQPIN
jgi:membrane-bound ClpP family serine protease